MYNDVPTTCFGRFLTGHHQVGIQCQRNYIPTVGVGINISVCTVRRPVVPCTHTLHRFKITLPNTDQAHEKYLWATTSNSSQA